eukprot:15232945-Alexandrium_andersonii.AAC.1
MVTPRARERAITHTHYAEAAPFPKPPAWCRSSGGASDHQQQTTETPFASQGAAPGSVARFSAK